MIFFCYFKKVNNSISYFGVPIPSNISNPNSIPISGSFILPNTEFKFDAYVIGFELYAANAGNIIIEVKKLKN